MRKKIIAGNWKMHMLQEPARSLASEIVPRATARPDVDVVLCPPYTALHVVRSVVEGSPVALGAQDCFWKEKGAYTGQVAPSMLRDAGATYVIVGHSETRGRFGVPEPDFDEIILAHFGESDKTVNLKLKAAISAGLVVICCVGETLAEREAGATDAIIQKQVAAAVDGVSEADMASVVFAYEPVWAIGTGKTCDAPEADRVCGVIRAEVSRLYSAATGDRLRVQYGGSVKPSNAADLLSCPNIDGALVGGASLVASDFCAIIEACG